MTSFFEKLAIDIILWVIPDAIERNLAGMEPELGLLIV
jgi:hypothetical protein